MRNQILLLIFATLLITACNKSDKDDALLTSKTTLQALVIDDEFSSEKDGKNDKGKIDCFELMYPLNLTMPDGSLLSGEKEELWNDVKSWYKANPNSKKKPSLNFPIDIQFKEDLIKTINNEGEMEAAKKYCDNFKDKKDQKDCFEFVYPINWEMPDGTSIAMNDVKDWNAVYDWYKANPSSKDKPSLNYPVVIEFKEGVTKTINNEEEMVIVKKECK